MLPGTPVEVAMTKWRDLPHWEYSGVFLGSDLYGDWIGIPAGTAMSRPGADYVAPVDQVSLVPPAHAGERGWLATFHGRGGEVEVYVDITTPPLWDRSTLRAVDLDLDVVRGTTGRVWVDDEDEFAEHRIALGLPHPAGAARHQDLRPGAPRGPRPAGAVRRVQRAVAGEGRRAHPLTRRVSAARRGPAAVRPGAGRRAGAPCGGPRGAAAARRTRRGSPRTPARSRPTRR